MKKLCICLSMCLIFLLSACGGVDSQINSYESALKANNIDKAAKVLQKLSEEKLTVQQKERILEIHDQYFETAIDKVIDNFEKYMEEGKLEKASKEIEGLQNDQLTISQAQRIAEISLKFASDEMSKYKAIMEDAMDISNSL